MAFIWEAGGALPVTAAHGDAVWNGSMFCVTRTGAGTIATSADGQSWVGQTPGGSLRGLDWGAGVFCVMNNGASTCRTSSDGVTWNSRTMPSNGSWIDVAWNGTVFAAIRNFSTAAASSTDGITWDARTMPSGSGWEALRWNGSVFCAVGTNDAAATSADGVTWEAQTIAPFTSVAFANSPGVAWNGSLFLAVTHDLTPEAFFATSPDGVTWTAATRPGPSTGYHYVKQRGHIGGVFVVTDQFGGVYTSTDGNAWTAHSVPVVNYWVGAAASDTHYLLTTGGSGQDETALGADSPFAFWENLTGTRQTYA